MQKYDKIKIGKGTYGMVFKGKNKEIQEVLASSLTRKRKF